MLYKGRRYFNLSNKSSHSCFAETTYVVENFLSPHANTHFFRLLNYIFWILSKCSVPGIWCCKCDYNNRNSLLITVTIKIQSRLWWQNYSRTTIHTEEIRTRHSAHIMLIVLTFFNLSADKQEHFLIIDIVLI